MLTCVPIGQGCDGGEVGRDNVSVVVDAMMHQPSIKYENILRFFGFGDKSLDNPIPFGKEYL